MTAPSFSKGTLLYVRYLDHVLFRNVQQPVTNAVERETVGWIFRIADDLIALEHDRTLPDPRITAGRASGVVIMKSAIIEIRRLQLQEKSSWTLASPVPVSNTCRPERSNYGKEAAKQLQDAGNEKQEAQP
jgi:hypothetical protein